MVSISPDLIKLVLILGVGAIVLIVGFTVQRRKRENYHDEKLNYHSNKTHTPSFSPKISKEEEIAKNYIENYKNSYPKESLKTSLLKAGNSENRVDEWLNKYY